MNTCENSTEMIAPEEVWVKRRVKGTGKKKINIELIERQQQKMVTFVKRRDGLYKKADKLSSIVGFKFAVIAFSPAGRLYTHGNPSFDKVFGNYLKFFDEREVENELERDENEVINWLRAISLKEYDDVEELVILKEKLLDIKEKVGKKIGGVVR